ncbi:MAG: hypothetical protein FWJ85_13505 [Solitalea sp.]
MGSEETIKNLHNPAASLSVDLHGGAIRDFHLQNGSGLNPLSFAFKREDMPLNNRNGAPYQGHFICLGRWGEPSEGERKAGLPNHGQAANLNWRMLPGTAGRGLAMEVDCPLEGLHLERRLRLDSRAAVFAVEETVTNTAPLGRLYNVVQHPTLAAPFLDEQVQIRCNAAAGFNQFEDDSPETEPLTWPYGRYRALGLPKIDLRTPSQPCTSVFSFQVDPADAFGWITVWSPAHRLMLGYLWNRMEYPWIHLWQDWDRDYLRYLGIEFGTTAYHQPFPQLLDRGLKLFGQKTSAYLDAGSKETRRYMGFLLETGSADPELEIDEGGGQLSLRDGRKQLIVETDFKEFLYGSN